MIYFPVFDSILRKKALHTVLKAVCEAFENFINARYTNYFFVCEKIFLIFFTGTICLEVQNPNALCSASVSSVLM